MTFVAFLVAGQVVAESQSSFDINRPEQWGWRLGDAPQSTLGKLFVSSCDYTINMKGRRFADVVYRVGASLCFIKHVGREDYGYRLSFSKIPSPSFTVHHLRHPEASSVEQHSHPFPDRRDFDIELPSAKFFFRKKSALSQDEYELAVSVDFVKGSPSASETADFFSSQDELPLPNIKDVAAILLAASITLATTSIAFIWF